MKDSPYLSDLCKPELWFRPQHYLRRLFARREPAVGRRMVRLPWGLPMEVDPNDTIGRQILTFGLFELPVSETLWRLVDAGDAVIDVGANMGYMSGLIASRTGAAGSVEAFEPHPAIFRMLESHVASWASSPALGKIRVHRVAASDSTGKAMLHDEGEQGSNCGLSSLRAAPGLSRAFEVETVRLDDLFTADRRFGVMKIDVEGAEILVLEGFRSALTAQRVRDVVFECGEAGGGDAGRFLASLGYTVFALGVGLLGPGLSPAADGAAPLRRWDSANFVATVDPARALSRLAPRGWRSLRGRAGVRD